MSDNDIYKRFGALKVMLVDRQPSSAQYTRALLSSLGIYQLQYAKNYEEFITLMQSQPADLIAFDAGTKTSEELEFLRRLRSEASSLALLPVLALSPETTKQDVYKLVNAGATELVGKPTNIKMLFGRLQTMIDSPRSYIATPDFKGPDRRRKQQPESTKESRTSRSPRVVSRADYLSGNMKEPVIIMPDFKLKAKMSHVMKEGMTKQVEDEFIFWALSDIGALEASHASMVQGKPSAAILERICSACLSLEARSEAYGYMLGCEVARRLLQFCQNDFDAIEPGHLLVVEKHIQILSIIYHGRLRGEGDEQGQALLSDLSKLVQKYQK